MDRSIQDPVEWIKDGEKILALIVRSPFSPSESVFLTDPRYEQQLGFIVYPAGSHIPRHENKHTKRKIFGTSECLIVRKGKTEVTIYNEQREEVCKRILEPGDVLLLVDCGHGFRQIEDTVMLEIKQGPYFGVEEKELF